MLKVFNLKAIFIYMTLINLCNNFSQFILFFTFAVAITLYDLFYRVPDMEDKAVEELIYDLSDWFSFIDYYELLFYFGVLDPEDFDDCYDEFN